MANRIIHVVVKFYAVVPDDPDEGDAWADEMSERIEKAVSGMEHGVVAESASVVDWTEEDD
jgi:hypothetical protein